MCSEIISYSHGECPMELECYEEDLSPAQKEAYYAAEKEFDEFRERFEAEMASINAKVIEREEFVTVYQIPLKDDSNNNSKIGTLKVKPTSNLLETTIAPSLTTPSQPASSHQYSSGSRSTIVAGPNNSVNTSNGPTTMPISTILLDTENSFTLANAIQQQSTVIIPVTQNQVVAKVGNTTNKVFEGPSPNPSRNNVTNMKKSRNAVQADKIVDLTVEKVGKNKLTFPSLVVLARPHLKHKYITPAILSQERSTLDATVKQTLNVPAGNFTEWLIQKGLVLCQQTCSFHRGCDNLPIKLKLAIFYKKERFRNSGGYVWIGDCCRNKFLSVYHKSLFEDEKLSAPILLKLIYHWACQTSIHNITNWVKVSNNQVKTFFSYLRSICTAAVWEKFGLLGGPNKKIQVSVISLITTNTETNAKKVRVEVIGVMDPENQYIRLRGVEPDQPENLNSKTRYEKILCYLPELVDKRSTIVVDHTVDKDILIKLGYNSIHQLSPSHIDTEIMEYLKTVLPRMFQNTLPLLTQPLIQQFLDELSWRERYGITPARAFNTFLTHLSEQTRIQTGTSLKNMLKAISTNPFKNWKYSEWKLKNIEDTNVDNDTRTIQLRSSTRSASQAASTHTNASSTCQGTKRPLSINSEEHKIIKKTKTSSTSSNAEDVVRGGLIPLEHYYYGTMKPNIAPTKVNPDDVGIPCCNGIYNRNMDLMRHLASHVLEGRTGYSPTDFMCKYCYENFKSDNQLNQHIQNDHKKNGARRLCCLICMRTFVSRISLIQHMQDNHKELEMPYHCTICHFRSSQCSDVIDHFYDVHKGCERVICPFCLRTVLLASNGKKLTNNVLFFINHIKRHKNLKNKKCFKCELRFLCVSNFKKHLKQDHTSYTNMPGVVRRSFSLNDTMMSLTLKIENINEPPKKVNQAYTTVNTNLRVSLTSLLKHKCIECSKIIVNDHQNHFRQLMSCLLCQYATCCIGAMENHVSNFHANKDKPNPQLVVELKNTIVCACGYRSTSGMEIANHLGKCPTSETVYLSSESLLSSLGTRPSLNIDLSTDVEHEKEPSIEMSASELRRRLEALTSRLTQGKGNQTKGISIGKETGRNTHIQLGETINGMKEACGRESEDDDVIDILMAPDIIMECEDDSNETNVNRQSSSSQDEIVVID